MAALPLALLGLAIAIVVAVVGYLLWDLKRRRQEQLREEQRRRERTLASESPPPPLPPPPLPAPPPVPESPTFLVVAVGLEISGKTVLLASMFHRLRTVATRRVGTAQAKGPIAEPSATSRDLAPDRHYYLRPVEHETWLATLYERVQDPIVPFDAATPIATPNEFTSDCMTWDDAENAHRVFGIRYLDYAGEILRRADDDPLKRRLLDSIQEADALLVMLDGHRVLDLLRGDPSAETYFAVSMGPIFRLAAEATCAVQLILTKWDLVCDDIAGEDEDEQLQRVIDRLGSCGQFPMLVHERRHRGLRVVPVSAVGPDLTAFDGRKIVKRVDGRIDPVYVEVPLCTVLPDVIALAERSLDPDSRMRLERQIGERVRRGQRAFEIVAELVGVILLPPTIRDLSRRAIVLLLEMATRRQADRVKAPRAPTPSQADEELTLRLRGDVITHMQRVVSRLERRMPCSVLTARDRETSR